MRLRPGISKGVVTKPSPYMRDILSFMSKSEARPTHFHAEALSLCHKAEAVVECLHYYFLVVFQMQT